MKSYFSSIWFFHTCLAGGPRPEAENKWLWQSRNNIAVRVEAERMNASAHYTKTTGIKSLFIMLGSKQPRPWAQIVGAPRAKQYKPEIAGNK